MKDYLSRINKIQDYIEGHIDGDLRLETLASLSYFSPYHFHRIFQGVTGETLNGYIKRIRLERALSDLVYQVKTPIVEIALKYGYSDHAVFSRAFKKTYGVSPSEARKMYSKNGKAFDYNDVYNRDMSQPITRADVSEIVERVEIRLIEALPIIYLRHVGSYESYGEKLPQMVEALTQYVISHQLLADDFNLFSLYHDNPEFTPPDKLRTSLCLASKAKIDVIKPFGHLILEKATYAVAICQVKSIEDGRKAWQYLYGSWMIESGYYPAEGAIYERYLNNGRQDDQGIQQLALYLPIKKL